MNINYICNIEQIWHIRVLNFYLNCNHINCEIFVTIHNEHFMIFNSYWVQNTTQNINYFINITLSLMFPFFKLYQLIRFNIFIKSYCKLFFIPTSVMSAVAFFKISICAVLLKRAFEKYGGILLVFKYFISL